MKWRMSTVFHAVLSCMYVMLILLTKENEKAKLDEERQKVIERTKAIIAQAEKTRTAPVTRGTYFSARLPLELSQLSKCVCHVRQCLFQQTVSHSLKSLLSAGRPITVKSAVTTNGQAEPMDGHNDGEREAEAAPAAADTDVDMDPLDAVNGQPEPPQRTADEGLSDHKVGPEPQANGGDAMLADAAAHVVRYIIIFQAFPVCTMYG